MMLIEMDVQSLAIMSRCPQFLKCSVPVCRWTFFKDYAPSPPQGAEMQVRQDQAVSYRRRNRSEASGANETRMGRSTEMGELG